VIKVSDYVVGFLVRKGISEVFMVAGGGIMHIMESVRSNSGMTFYCNYNEQATAYATEGYARAKNGLAACIVTTGPGSTNALSGVASAWADSVPMIVISGQVKTELIADYSKLRQIGEQEVNITDMARPVTKYARTVTRPELVRYELEKCSYYATDGRPGPVWLNIPLDVQARFVDERKLASFKPPMTYSAKDRTRLKNQVKQSIKMLKGSKRPVLLCGYGVRIAGAVEALRKLLESVRIPVVLSFNGMDLLPDDHRLLVGKPGIIGQRRANFAIQNSDCILSLGSRLNIKIVGYGYRAFAPRARKIIVDVDKEELLKPTISADLPIQADGREFLKEFSKQVEEDNITVSPDWLQACSDWKRRYPNIAEEFFSDKGHVNTYVFYDTLSDALQGDEPVVSGNGLAALNLYQAYRVRSGQRAFTNNGYGAMGWGLPAAIGACIANNRGKTICVTGDGSIQMNLQELEFLRYHDLPLKIFVFNNSGYTSIRLTQDAFFGGKYIGSDRDSGVANPDFERIALAYGLGYLRISRNDELEPKIKDVLSMEGPVLCELNISPRQGISPKTQSYKKDDGTLESRPLEDMFPFLPRQELEENMNISKE